MCETLSIFGKQYGDIVGIKIGNIANTISRYKKKNNDIFNAEVKDVNFIDYDGSIIYSYTAQEFDALSTLPSNPYHKGLVSQGWNWTKEQIEDQLEAYPTQLVYVGQIYITASGATEIDVTFDDQNYLSPYLVIGINGAININWGDGSPNDILTGSSLLTPIYQQHTYVQTGSYTISINVTSGSFSFARSNNNIYAGILRTTNVEDNKRANRTYAHAIKAIRIGSNVTSIANYAFGGCYSLTSITIPSGVTSIVDNAFVGCYSLTSITIPSEVTSIGIGAFQSCFSLASIAIPSGVTNISGSAFEDCHSLASITIPSGVTSIGTSVFSGCCSLKSITIPSGVTSIGTSMFSYCYCLRSITIPSGVTSIENSAFYNCYSLTSITIPSGVTSIGNSTFQGCRSLISVTIPSGVTSIGNSAFSYCYSLTSVTIPSGVTSIGTSVFSGCYSLTSITIPSGVTSIRTTMFNVCYSLTSITIPSGVTNIESGAFQDCYSITEYHLLSTTPPTLASTNAFTSIATDCIICVPVGTLSTYQSATNWSTYASYMREEGA